MIYFLIALIFLVAALLYGKRLYGLNKRTFDSDETLKYVYIGVSFIAALVWPASLLALILLATVLGIEKMVF